MKKYRVILSLLVCLSILPVVSCNTSPVSVIQGAMENVDWYTVVSGTIKAIEGFQTAAKLGIKLPCALGLLDHTVCEAYTLADSKADEWIPKAKTALAAYKADSNANNLSALKVVYDALVEAWNEYQGVNDVQPYIDSSGQAIVTESKEIDSTSTANPSS